MVPLSQELENLVPQVFDNFGLGFGGQRARFVSYKVLLLRSCCDGRASARSGVLSDTSVEILQLQVCVGTGTWQNSLSPTNQRRET